MREVFSLKDISFCKKVLEYSSLVDRGELIDSEELLFKEKKHLPLSSFELISYSEDDGYEVKFTSKSSSDKVDAHGYIFPSNEEETVMSFIASAYHDNNNFNRRVSVDGIEEVISIFGNSIKRESYCFSDASLSGKIISSKKYDNEDNFVLEYFSRFAPIDLSYSKKHTNK